MKKEMRNLRGTLEHMVAQVNTVTGVVLSVKSWGSLVNEFTGLSHIASSVCVIHPELMQVPGEHKDSLLLKSVL